MFWWQSETLAEHNDLIPHEKAAYLIATHILRNVLTEETYEEVVLALENCSGDHHLV
jgi:hypothetical protein